MKDKHQITYASQCYFWYSSLKTCAKEKKTESTLCFNLMNEQRHRTNNAVFKISNNYNL